MGFISQMYYIYIYGEREDKLIMSSHSSPRQAMFPGLREGWKKARGSVKSVTFGLCHVDRYGLPGLGPCAYCNQQL